MSWEFVYLEKDKVLKFIFSGEYLSEHIKGFRAFLRDKCSEFKVKKCLLDFRSGEYDVSILDISRTPDALKSEDMVAGYNYCMIADPSSKSYSKMKMLSSTIDTKNYLYDYKIKYRLFHSEKDGIEWFNSIN